MTPKRPRIGQAVLALGAGIGLPFLLLAAPAVLNPDRAARAALAFPMAPLVEYGAQKVVYQVSQRGSWRDRSREAWRLVHVLNNHIRAVEPDDVTIAVLFHGDGIDALQRAKDDPNLGHAFDALRKRGVKFRVCLNTLQAYAVPLEALHGVKADDLVQAAVAELVHLQKQGYAYIRF